VKGLAALPAVFSIECLKLKRTLALAMVVLAPTVILILAALIGYNSGGRMVRDGNTAWPQLTGNAVGLWTLLMMPMFVTLETSLLAGLEHGNGNWKGVLSLPVPRWTIYISKLLVTIGLLWMANAVLLGGMMGIGVLLRAVQPDLELVALPLDPLLRPLLVISAAALLGLTIQHWVSLRFGSAAAAIGFGMMAMVTGFVAANSNEWGRRWPWAMPIHAVRPNHPGELDLVVVGVVGAVMVALIGSWEFSRREIK
jgi:lantibiotic transport system permease protein